jgi:hypothetical protein
MHMRLLLALVVSALTACASVPDGFNWKPQPLSRQDTVSPNMAVLLVGVVGPGEVDYLQFGHSAFPAINVRFPGQGDSIIAIPLPVGLKKLALSSITLKGRPGFYVGGMAMGYVGVHTHSLDLDKPGLYFLATLDTARPGRFAAAPVAEQLAKLRSELGGTLSGLDPVNFTWPGN